MGDLFQKGGNMSKRLKVRIMKAVIAGALSVMAVVLFQAGDAAAEIKFGTLPRLSAAELQTMYAPLVEYLSKETGEQISIVVPKSFEAFKDEVKAGRIDVGFANPLVYVELKNKVNVEPLVLSSEVKSGTRIRGIIIARKDSGITRIQDLQGKKISFMDKDSAAGYIFQLFLLSKAGAVGARPRCPGIPRPCTPPDGAGCCQFR